MLNAWLFKRHLDDDEEVIRIIHKHWFTGLKFLFFPVVVFFGLIALLAIAFSIVLFYIIAIIAVFVLVWGLRNFLDYYLDAWMITDTGIVDVEWHGWFHRQSSRVLYSDLQGVSYEINGIGETVLRYGTISVEKISTGTEISMEYVSRPREVEALILKCMEDYVYKKNLKDATAVQDILANVIAREMQLKDLRGEEDDSNKKKK